MTPAIAALGPEAVARIEGICPAALGTKDQQPAAFSPETGLFYVPTNHVCMDYEPFKVNYTAGQPYVGATLSMYPPPGENFMGNFIAWDAQADRPTHLRRRRARTTAQFTAQSDRRADHLLDDHC
jgi:hypothetical protein